ncbi:MAG: ornithine carbamoyltransferase [Pirellulales bacterium]
MRHVVSLFDLSTAEIEAIFAITRDLKAKHAAGLRETILPGRVVALLFEKPSLRTRVSFETGIAHLGGNSLFLGSEVGFNARESLADFGRVISQYVDAIVVRAFRHETVAELAKHCTCAVINGLTDYTHPCQGLADLYTLRELLGKFSGHKVAYVGDANNVARSLAIGCARLDLPLSVAAPKGYGFDEPFLARLRSEEPNAKLALTEDPAEAVRGASAVYTDVWTSMGQEAESQRRLKDFAGFQVDGKLMSLARADAYFLHCLPAHRGEEVAAEVIDGPQSVVVEQAANRMHVQKGVLTWLLGRE